MIKSMTGFGRGTAISNEGKINVEIKSLNSRYLDIKF
ncbi:MAG: YicC/YloC family endoribonuclease, partial [Candidatus Neomarinimicrobiota bacterium]|nr:YicC/YloC family endoribonuclease [Candidatus Neomarinimicrobiota bacterium]